MIAIGSQKLFQIEIGIAIAISISHEDRDRDRDLDFGDRGHALRMTKNINFLIATVYSDIVETFYKTVVNFESLVCSLEASIMKLTFPVFARYVHPCSR